MTLGELLERYQREISPTKRGSVQEIQRIDVLRRHDLTYQTMIRLSQQDSPRRAFPRWML